MPQTYDSLKSRIIAKLEDRLDPDTSKRMPSSLLRQSLLSAAEQVTEQEARSLSKADRARMIEEVLAELLGYGPLAELFQDATVREVMVVGAHAVIVRREGGDWLPSNIKFRDEDHLRAALDRLAVHADPVGGITTSVNLFDLKLPNGFRAVGVVPPEALGVSVTAAFVRFDTDASLRVSTSQGSGAHSIASAREVAEPAPGSGTVSGVKPRTGSAGDFDMLAPHRKRIIEKLITKMASLGVYDVRRVEITELRRIVAAYITEYCLKEHIYISDTDQGRLQLEILTAMHR